MMELLLEDSFWEWIKSYRKGLASFRTIYQLALLLYRFSPLLDLFVAL
jgi:hypothetical protein